MKGTRREFLGQSVKTLATGLVGSSVLSSIDAAAASGGQQGLSATSKPASRPDVELRPLGRTGLKISVVSLGAAHTSEAAVRYALDQGINFIHVSTDYQGGKAIRDVARAIRGRKKDSVYLGLKVLWSRKTDEPFEQALRLLGRDYVDILFFQIHALPEKVAAAETRAAFDRWRKQGKARFVGLTTHGGMKECMEAALDAGWYDCLMPIYNLGMRPDYLEIFRRCEKQEVGFIAMKTQASEKDTRPIPVMLQDRAVTTICKTMDTLSQVRTYLSAAREKLTPAATQKALTEAAMRAIGRCRMCGTCTAACPAGLAVNDIVRSVDYYVDTMGDLHMGEAVYRQIEACRSAGGCRACGRCEETCPRGVPVRSFVRRAREMFV